MQNDPLPLLVFLHGGDESGYSNEQHAILGVAAKHVADYKASAEIVREIASTSNGSKVTVYPKQGHDAWTQTYTMTGQGFERPEYAPFDEDVFQWLLQHQNKLSK